MTADREFGAQLTTEMPRLRAFGAALAGSRSAADDLVQETLAKAWKHRARFAPGTNLRAWLFTILRNTFRSQRRKLGREIGDDGRYADRLPTPARQHARLEMMALRAALDRLPRDQRQAVVLVGIAGCSYEEAAARCATAEGTVKSRVNRARRRLALMLEFAPGDGHGPEAPEMAILSRPVGDGSDRR
jgi:RNA polymerase sigma-70 factor (ECF subfamily)